MYTSSAKLYGLCALFYLYQFILRLAPSVMMEDLMQAFSMDATGFATLGSIALFSYALFQIPAGIFADVYGVRRTVLIFLTLCITGTFLFAISFNMWGAQGGRFLIGLGSAAAFLSVSKLIGQNFPRKNQATFLGLTMVVGTLGALNGGIPLCAVIQLVGWRHALLIMCGIGLALLGLIFFFLNDPHLLSRKHIAVTKSLKQVLSHKDCWIFAGTAMGLYIAICVLGDLWGVAFMMNTHGIHRTQAVELISTLYMGLCVGSFFLAWVSDVLQKAKFLIIFSTLMLCLLFGILLSPLSLPYLAYYPLFFLIGFFSGAEMLCFAGACKALPSSAAGTTTGFLNGLVMMGGALIQQGVGLVLDYNWAGEWAEGGIKAYSAADYRLALSLMVPIIVLALTCSFFITEKETMTALQE